MIEITKQSQMELLKTNVIKDNNFFNQQINRLNRAVKTRSEFEDRSTGIIQTEKKKKSGSRGEKQN